MRRTLAIALAAGVLLLGGCDRARAAGSAGPPAADQPPASTATPAATAHTGTQVASATSPPAAAATGTGDVGSLLNSVDKQLSSDDQPAQDQD